MAEKRIQIVYLYASELERLKSPDFLSLSMTAHRNGGATSVGGVSERAVAYYIIPVETEESDARP